MPIAGAAACREYPHIKPSVPQPPERSQPERSQMVSQLRELASFIAFFFTGKLH